MMTVAVSACESGDSTGIPDVLAGYPAMVQPAQDRQAADCHDYDQLNRCSSTEGESCPDQAGTGDKHIREKCCRHQAGTGCQGVDDWMPATDPCRLEDLIEAVEPNPNRQDREWRRRL